MKQGYFRHPAIHRDRVVFVSEDDLWSVNIQGGTPVRLTSNLGEIEFPLIAPDGAHIAFIARDEGVPDIHIMETGGGNVQRITFQGLNRQVAAWSPDGEWIYYVTDAGQPTRGSSVLGRVRARPGHHQVETVNLGRAHDIGFGPAGGIVLGRNTGDPARWKRYRGGTAGHLWISPETDAPFVRLHQDLSGNLASPMWVPDPDSDTGRIYFLSDHEGVGNLYSSLPSGEDLRRHTHHTDFYARFASWGPTPDGGVQIVYHAGADLYRFDAAADETASIPIAYASPGVQRNRKFVPAAAYLESADLHPQGHSLALVARGKAFVMGNHEGAVVQLGQRDGIRYRLATWLQDGQQVVAVSDEPGEERLQVFRPAVSGQVDRMLEDFDFGRAHDVYASPTDNRIVLVNHRSELWLCDLETDTATLVDRSPHGRINHVAWSPDGRWLAYEFAHTLYASRLRLYRLAQAGTDEAAEDVPARIIDLTEPVLRDMHPVFDPKGRYLYFLSSRILNPTYDTLQFDLSFTRGMRPYLITLQAEQPNPFVPRAGEEEREQKAEAASADTGQEKPEAEEDRAEDKTAAEPVRIDLEGIQNRIVPFPVAEGLFTRLAATEERVFWLEDRARATLPDPYVPSLPQGGHLQTWILAEYKQDSIAQNVDWFALAADGKKLIFHTDHKLRIISAAASGEALQDEGPPRATGWVDLERIRIAIDPYREWQQMFREAWRLQRDQFWTADMSRIDWQTVFDRYFPLVDRVGCRQEFSDLMWEMQGELGTSHAYEMGGDYRPRPHYPLGSLGATLQWRGTGYEVMDWLTGDVWEPGVHSPFAEPGIDVARGDMLIAINGQPLSDAITPEMLLVNLADQEVQLTFLPRPEPKDGPSSEAPSDTGREGAPVRHITVRTLASEARAHYRTWVDRNRIRVHERSRGRLGYLHIPDMGPRGFAEFHRGFLGGIHREGMVVDLRFNGGGHVSELLLEKLARRRVGYDLSRWEGLMPYPRESVAGPMVALTNEAAGSDGDIFSHCFKLMQLGPLIGMRTWGGVIGIWPRHALVDGTVTTQPEYSFWFRDVGWNVENYGTDPDIEVDITPDDYRREQDPQLDRAIDECLALLAENPPLPPQLDNRPDLSLPTLLSPAKAT